MIVPSFSSAVSSANFSLTQLMFRIWQIVSPSAQVGTSQPPSALSVKVVSCCSIVFKVSAEPPTVNIEQPESALKIDWKSVAMVETAESAVSSVSMPEQSFRVIELRDVCIADIAVVAV